MIVLRRINLRRIFKEFNRSEDDISRNNGSEEDIYEEDFSKRKAPWEIQSEVMTCISRYFDCRLRLFDFKFLLVSRKHSNILQVDIIKLIPWFSINWCIWSCNNNYRIVSPRIMYDWRVVWQSCFPYFQHLSITKMDFAYSSLYYLLLDFGWFLEQCVGNDVRHAQIPSHTNKTRKWP